MKNHEKQDEQTVKDIKEEQAKLLFQFIDHENGSRSQAVTGNAGTIMEIIKAREPGQKPRNEDYIIVLAVLSGENTFIPETPIILVDSFIKLHPNQVQPEETKEAS